MQYSNYESLKTTLETFRTAKKNQHSFAFARSHTPTFFYKPSLSSTTRMAVVVAVNKSHTCVACFSLYFVYAEGLQIALPCCIVASHSHISLRLKYTQGLYYFIYQINIKPLHTHFKNRTVAKPFFSVIKINAQKRYDAPLWWSIVAPWSTRKNEEKSREYL